MCDPEGNCQNNPTIPRYPGLETPDECVIHPAQCGYVEDQDPYPGLPPATSESHEFTTPFSLDSVTRMRGLQWNKNILIHNGVDYAGSTGTNITASGTGVVVIVDYCTLQPTCVNQEGNESASVNGGFGTVVIIEYGYDSLSDEVRAAYKLQPGQSLYVLYGHLSSIDVRRGDVVTAGTVIGQMGSTGSSSGPHLHAEFRTGASGQIWSSSLCTGSERCTGQPTWSAWYGLKVVDPEVLWN